MEVVVCADEREVGRVAAAKIAEVAVACGPEYVLGLCTGSSPLATYRELARSVDAGKLDLSGAWGFALDEYIGLPQRHPESYAEVIRRTVTGPLKLDPDRVVVPDGFAADLEAAAREFEQRMLAVGGVDMQLLGIGTNGHIGFNEPGSSFDSRTRVETLTDSTRCDNSRYFSSLAEVPRRCITQGLATIMEARAIVLLATGRHKAGAVAAVVDGPRTTDCPGSVLQTHPHVTVVVDASAASSLRSDGASRLP